MDAYAVVMAGGRGERLWPLSTPEHPKPFLRLFNGKSLLEATLDRLAGLFPEERTLLLLREDLKPAVEALEPKARVVYEPSARDTAGALVLALAHVAHEAPQARLVLLPADHYVNDTQLFQNDLTAALEAADPPHVVTLGIPPTRPETGYGYIRLGARENGWHRAEAFVEKPTYATALHYLQSRQYLWNAGIFAFAVPTMEALLEAHLPEHYRAYRALRAAIGTDAYPEVLAEHWATLPKTSIDYGIMEKAPHVRVIPARFGWDDVGTWRALERTLPLDEYDNAVAGTGRHVGVETRGCVIYAQDGLVATLGVSGLIVAQLGKTVLVADKERAHEVRELVRRLENGQAS
ncbi:mannose-1-phosphate guanylyltransferase [Marinithermus hydrothermalis]|uniref:Mannose-1-phosphate guanylyltransferase n=1 Tax=Marinithermus hydrothermalis (strain DSM 14884 / JCM 11576 / T1) TaxID=869210 RepID=F2NLY8_MARHT|nr:mannose-1-phosphate guanylyltransferase [Marinithermus hydrothermalis]AEB11245.1 Mannose-1-phosphate guanylyltransferase [Marinithermus hydrothermalis DSM 14884]